MPSTVEQRHQEVATASQEIAESTIAYFEGAFVPLADAKISIATHALQYGTAVFEGIRAYWNPAREQLYVFRLREHFERMAGSVRILRVALPGDASELARITVELLKRNSFRNDVYIRPVAYKAARTVKVALKGIRDGFGMYAFPLGAYLPTGGLVAHTASWRRTPDDAIPARGKLTGAYINTALAVDEALDYGADEAIFLTGDGHVSEGGGANLFMVRDGALVTPPVTADILEGITRDTILALARELGIAVQERAIDRTELYIADEVFFCGTGAQVAPCVQIDGRTVGRGDIGPVGKRIGDAYIAIARGDDDRHPEWRTAVYR
ncbi:MAG: branched-chain amino acid transaminase [Chloroflexi bacterium]|nr:MAG: branched-chain amino acid transaminase [Chloroflexota bacterium]TMG40650.1 MAG: branched-chain amino acid transaminase [Chloroflexota bacterium]